MKPKSVTVTWIAAEGGPCEHESYDKWHGRAITLPPIGPKDAIQVHVDY